jgi:hypothetical protein
MYLGQMDRFNPDYCSMAELELGHQHYARREYLPALQFFHRAHGFFYDDHTKLLHGIIFQSARKGDDGELLDDGDRRDLAAYSIAMVKWEQDLNGFTMSQADMDIIATLKDAVRFSYNGPHYPHGSTGAVVARWRIL